MMGNGLGPGGRGKEERGLRRLTTYMPIISPKIAMNIVENILDRI
jgi:hypothetical protein